MIKHNLLPLIRLCQTKPQCGVCPREAAIIVAADKLAGYAGWQAQHAEALAKSPAAEVEQHAHRCWAHHCRLTTATTGVALCSLKLTGGLSWEAGLNPCSNAALLCGCQVHACDLSSACQAKMSHQPAALTQARCWCHCAVGE
jgi:hypothetical protein